MNKQANILVVDDEDGIRQFFNTILRGEYNILLAEAGMQAIDICKKNTLDLALLDIRLPDIDGIALLEKLRDLDPEIEVIMITAVNEVQTAVKAIKLGAAEYVVKPFLADDILTIIRRTLENRCLVRGGTYLSSGLDSDDLFEGMIGKDKKMRAVFDLVYTISESNGTVLVQGESGTGKDLVARAIHNLSPRKGRPFVVIDCAAMPPNLMESELFGYNKGAFTGANYTVLGKLEGADGGTVFLDDVDTLNINMQAKLLRVIQEKEFRRLGSSKVINVDIRFVAASNKDLQELISRGEFREDLFYRLNVFPIKLPPLRKRRDDIPLFLNHFLEMFSQNAGKSPKRFSKKAIKALMEYDWPGNVRELKNLVERLSTTTKKPVIDLEDISTLNIDKIQIRHMRLKGAVNTFEKGHIREALEIARGNKKKAAEMLGVHRNTLLTKINDLGLKI